MKNKIQHIWSFGDRLENGTYLIHSRFKRAVNFVTEDSLVSIVDKEIGAGPLNIVVKGIGLNSVDSLVIDKDGFLLNGLRFEFDYSKRYVSKIEYDGVDHTSFVCNLDFLESWLKKISPPQSLAFLLDEKRKQNFKTSFEKEFVKRFEFNVPKIFSSKFSVGIRMIKGAGFGFTPSGDDFIAGFLIALNVAQKMFRLDLSARINEIYKIARGKNPISNAFLLCAKEGLLFEKFKNLIHSILFHGKIEILKYVKNLLSVGATSGADIGVGFVMGMKGITTWS